MNDTDQSEPVTQEASEPLVTRSKKRPTGAFVGLNEAHRMTGKSKETILRYAKDGRLSAHLNEQGNKTYQVVDLERIFGFVTTATSPKSGQADHIEPGEKQGATPLKVARLEGEIAKLEAMLEAERDKSRMLATAAQKAEQNADDWKQQAERATLMLTHRPEPATATAPRWGILGRLLGGGSR